MAAKVPTIDSGTARLGMIVADRLRRNRKMTRTTRAIDRRSVNSTSWTDSRIATERSDRVHDLDGVRPRLALDGEDHGPLVVVPARDLAGLHAVDNAPQLLEPDGRAVAVRHDERAEGGGVRELARGLDIEHLVGAVERAGRQVDVAARERLLDLVDADASRGERAGVELDTDGVLLGAEHLDLRDPVDRGDALRQVRLGVVVDGVERERREVDVREVAHRQEPEPHDPEEQDRGHEERREDGPPDEELGAHEALGGLISTLAPGTSRSWPSVTMRSPARRPCSMMVSAPRRVPGTTGRDSTVASAFTTKMKGPCWPGWIACEGTTIAVRLVSVSATSRNWPGQSALSLFANVALSWMV